MLQNHTIGEIPGEIKKWGRTANLGFHSLIKWQLCLGFLQFFLVLEVGCSYQKQRVWFVPDYKRQRLFSLLPLLMPHGKFISSFLTEKRTKDVDNHENMLCTEQFFLSK